MLIFVLRLAIGALFITAGAFKAHDGVGITAMTINAYRILPSFAVVPLAAFLPYLEIGLGCYLVAGLFTRVVAAVLTAQLLVFSAAIASAVVRHLTISCGCFGAGDASQASWVEVLRDVAAAGITAWVAWKGPGRFAVDTRLFGEGEANESRSGETVGV